jgi:hypothetical protein
MIRKALVKGREIEIEGPLDSKKIKAENSKAIEELQLEL